VLSYPTDLAPGEQQIAQGGLDELAVKLTADGTLRSTPWREVFTSTWRHPYVPSFYPELGAPCLLCIDPQRRREWLDTVYSDQTLITKVVQVPRFLPYWAGFMWLRHTPDIPGPQPPPWCDDEPVKSLSQLDPTLLQSDPLIGFVAQCPLPEATWGPAIQNGPAAIHLWAPDGSCAAIHCVPSTHGYPVSQAGPQQLWNRVEEAYEFWRRAGRPSYDRFGITATPTDQYIWYDHPDSTHRWRLPTPSRHAL
jgi:hypothetical protein